MKCQWCPSSQGCSRQWIAHADGTTGCDLYRTLLERQQTIGSILVEPAKRIKIKNRERKSDIPLKIQLQIGRCEFRKKFEGNCSCGFTHICVAKKPGTDLSENDIRSAGKENGPIADWDSCVECQFSGGPLNDSN